MSLIAAAIVVLGTVTNSLLTVTTHVSQEISDTFVNTSRSISALVNDVTDQTANVISSITQKKEPTEIYIDFSDSEFQSAFNANYFSQTYDTANGSIETRPIAQSEQQDQIIVLAQNVQQNVPRTSVVPTQMFSNSNVSSVVDSDEYISVRADFFSQQIDRIFDRMKKSSNTLNERIDSINVSETPSLSFATIELGGTGTSTTPTYGELLMGDGTGSYTLVATSSLGLGGSAGTLTSVDMTVPTGLTVSGGPITTSGTFALDFTSGYSIPLTASSTNWNSFYDLPSIRITAGTGLSWVGNTLNAESSGTVNSGVSGAFSYYPSTGTTLDDQSVLYLSGSNVGVGTTTPSESLSVVGNGYFSGNITATNVLSSIINDTSNVSAIDVTNRRLLDTGTINALDFSSASYIKLGQYTTNGFLKTSNGNGTLIVDTTSYQPALVSGTSLKTVNGTTLLGSGDVGTIDVAHGGTGLTTLGTNYIPYGNGTSAFGGSSNATVDSGGNAFFAGNMGIGTTTPSGLIDVGSQNDSIRFVLDTSSASTDPYGLGFDTTGRRISMLSTQGTIRQALQFGDSAGSTGTIFGIGASNDSGSNWTPGIIVKQGGNVGIGESSPGSKLSVSGSATIGSSYDTTAAPTNGLLVQGGTAIGTNTNASLTEFGSRDFALRVDSTNFTGYGIVLERTDQTVNNGSPVFALMRKNLSSAAVSNGNELGRIGGWGWDGDEYVLGGETSFVVDGTVSDQNVPTAFTIKTGTQNSTLAERLRVTSSGNVGIGTTAPGVKLDITGEHTSGQGMFRLNGTTHAIATYNAASGNNSGFHFNTNSALKWYFNNVGTDGTDRFAIASRVGGDVERFSILQNGNVGIGTTNPSAKLHLSDGNTPAAALIPSGPALISSKQASNNDFYLITAGVSGAANSGVLGSVASRGTLASPTAVASGDSLLRIIGAGYDGSASQYAGRIHFEVDGSVSSGNVPTALAFRTGVSSASQTERMRITSSGNVGIGTTSPQAKLSIAGDTIAAGAVTIGGNTNTTQLIVRGAPTQNFNTFDIQNSAGASRFAVINSSESPRVMLSYGTGAGADFTGSLNSVEQLSFGFNNAASFGGSADSNSGRLMYFFDRVSNAYRGAIGPAGDFFWGTNSTNGYSVRLGVPSTAMIPLTVQGRSGQTANLFEINTYGQTGGDVFGIKSTGGIGVGTTNLTDAIAGTAKFKIDTGTTEFGFIDNAGEGYMSVSNGTVKGFGGHVSNTDGVVFGAYSNHKLTLRSGGNVNRLTIDTSGNVGIGTTSPLATFDVGGLISDAADINMAEVKGAFSTNYNGVSGIVMGNTSLATDADFRFSIKDTNDSSITFSMPGAGNNLNLFGSARTSSSYIFSNGTSALRNLTIGTVNTKDLIFGTNNIERMRILSDGNIGIGITSPQTRLSVGSVTSALSTAAGSNALTVSINSAGSAIALASENRNGSDGAFSALYRNTGVAMTAGNRLGGFLIGGSSNSTSLHNSVLIAGFAEQNWTHGSAYGSYLTFETISNNSTSRTEKMRLSADGNLGIGTTTPFKKLSVTGTVAFDGLASSVTGNALCITTNKEVTDSGGSSCIPSSIRFKENVVPLEQGYALQKLSQLKVVGFDYKEKQDHETNQSYGLIAEEVAKIDRNLVDYGYDGLPVSLHFEKITGLLVQAVQEQNLAVARLSLIIDSDETLPEILISRILQALSQVSNLVVRTLTADKVQTKELCVEDVCVTKEQFLRMIQNSSDDNNGSSGSNNNSSNSEENSGEEADDSSDNSNSETNEENGYDDEGSVSDENNQISENNEETNVVESETNDTSEHNDDTEEVIADLEESDLENNTITINSETDNTLNESSDTEPSELGPDSSSNQGIDSSESDSANSDDSGSNEEGNAGTE